ncbi:hypothetical protein D9M68_973060 [compost metagenome]
MLIMASTVDAPATGRLQPLISTMASSIGAQVSMTISAASARRLPEEWLAGLSRLDLAVMAMTVSPRFLA